MPSKMLNKDILLQLFGGANKNIANGGGGGARGRRFSISFFGEDGQRHPSRRVRLRKRVVTRDAENKPLVLKSSTLVQGEGAHRRIRQNVRGDEERVDDK